MTPDATDLAILRTLQQDGQTSNKDLSIAVGLSPSATLGRVRGLFQDGYVRNVTAVLNPSALGLTLLAFVLVDVEFNASGSDLMEKLASEEHVLEAHTVTGSAFCILKVRTTGTEQLNEVIFRIMCVQGVRNTNTLIVLHSYKESTAIPLPAAGGQG